MIMRTTAALLFALGLLTAACGGGSESASTLGTSSTSGTQAPGSTSSSTSTLPPSTAPPSTLVADGPAAPDFTLDLGSGGRFTLSDEQKPVYMVFWAEW